MNTADYINDLVIELRLLDVPGDRIGQIMTETESHLAESKEDPVEAFGPARTYARELAGRVGADAGGKTLPGRLARSIRGRDWLIIIGGFACTFAGATLLFNGVFGVLGRPTWLGLPAWLLIVAGVVLLVLFAIAPRALHDPIVDPVTGESISWTLKGAQRK